MGLIANERGARPALGAPIAAALGHEVIAREIEVTDVGAVTARERPDVALRGIPAIPTEILRICEQDFTVTPLFAPLFTPCLAAAARPERACDRVQW